MNELLVKDKRSRKVAFVAHCILNYNAKVNGLAGRESMDIEVIELLHKHGYGIAQLPCPETTYMGLRRWWHVREQYDNIGFREHCREILKPTIKLMREFKRMGYEVIVIGVEGSPSCGVRFTGSSSVWGGKPEDPGEYPLKKGCGVFMEVLYEEIVRNKLEKPRATGVLIGLPGYSVEDSIRDLEFFLKNKINYL